MKKSEAIKKISQFQKSQDPALSEEEVLGQLLDFLENEKIMLPFPLYRSKEGVSYDLQWEEESESEND